MTLTMQTPIIISLIVLASIALIIGIDLYRAKQTRSKPKKVEQIPHSQHAPAKTLEPAEEPAEAKAKPLEPVEAKPAVVKEVEPAVKVVTTRPEVIPTP